MKVSKLLPVLLLACGHASFVQAQIAHLVLNSSGGAYLGGGQSWDLTYTPQNTYFGFLAARMDHFAPSTGEPTSVRFSLGGPQMPFASLTFSLGNYGLGSALVPGSYVDANLGNYSTPALDIGFNGYGAQNVPGEFRILNFDYTLDPLNPTAGGFHSVDYFLAEFEETYPWNPSGVIRGKFEYSATTLSSVPEPSTYGLAAVILLLAPACIKRVRNRIRKA